VSWVRRNGEERVRQKRSGHHQTSPLSGLLSQQAYQWRFSYQKQEKCRTTVLILIRFTWGPPKKILPLEVQIRRSREHGAENNQTGNPFLKGKFKGWRPTRKTEGREGNLWIARINVANSKNGISRRLATTFSRSKGALSKASQEENGPKLSREAKSNKRGLSSFPHGGKFLQD